MIQRGVTWNLSGTLVSVLCQFAAIPILVNQLGPKGMGVIAFSWLVTAIIGALEMGLAPALSGELARRRGEAGAQSADRRLVRAFEVPCWTIALTITVVMAISGAWIVRHWLSQEEADAGMQLAVRMMGLVAGLTLPMALYVNGLLGIEAHRSANLTRILTSLAVHGGGALVVLWHPSPRAWLLMAIIAQMFGVLI
ncbi:lipopolysaccharide biosynthesis protein [Desulfatirhabdium butyrativorans]|uniref:lipopolysaccharide biosynthesis protein n=1 Tax=Desulfatirhabdium butyrativorans TaxID=340467 RepID=UPI00040D27DC|nr:oligosaccharide flippase family protein [Desulfatirhabdium butyrativorans]